jgi:hypothetical protein
VSDRSILAVECTFAAPWPSLLFPSTGDFQQDMQVLAEKESWDAEA